MVDGDQVVRASGGEPDFKHIVGATPGVKYRAAAALAMRIDQLGDLRVEARLAQRCNNKIAFPGPIGGSFPMLHGAAAAHAEVRANRRDAFGARCIDVEKSPPVGMSRHPFDLNRLAWQRAGNIDRPVGAVGDPVAEMAKPVDHKPLNHAAPR